MNFSLKKLGYPGRGRRDTREAVQVDGGEVERVIGGGAVQADGGNVERVFEGLEGALLKLKVSYDGLEGAEVSSMDAKIGSAGSY
jgi:hypothetical protein